MATAAALPDWSVRGRWGACSVRDCEGDLGALAWWQRRRDLNPQSARTYCCTGLETIALMPPAAALRRKTAFGEKTVFNGAGPARRPTACRRQLHSDNRTLGRKSIFADLCPAGISTAPPVQAILVPVHTRPSGGRRLLELFSRLKSCSFGLLSSYCRASDRINVRRTPHTEAQTGVASDVPA